LSAPLIQDKKVLKDIVYSRVPREIMDRPKMGFGIPLGSWLRNELKELTYDSLLGQSVKISQFCDSQVMKTLVDEHNSGRANHQSTLYSLISLSLWLDRNLA
jgi:asparagine synthase (glutamine-hydrolysing)